MAQEPAFLADISHSGFKNGHKHPLIPLGRKKKYLQFMSQDYYIISFYILQQFFLDKFRQEAFYISAMRILTTILHFALSILNSPRRQGEITQKSIFFPHIYLVFAFVCVSIKLRGDIYGKQCYRLIKT